MLQHKEQQLSGRALVVLGMAVVLSACSGEAVGEGDSDGTAAEDVGVIQQKVSVGSWTPGAFAPYTAGFAVAQNTGRTYHWTTLPFGSSNYLYCNSPSFSPCSDPNATVLGYASPTHPSHIRAMGISKSNGHVYAFYDVNTTGGTGASVSEGVSNSLGSLSTFTVPVGVSIDNLLEADMSDNGLWYFYWKVGNQVFRSTSNTSTAGGTLSNVPVSVVSTNIVGLSFYTGSPALIFTYYGDSASSLTISTNSLNLL